MANKQTASDIKIICDKNKPLFVRTGTARSAVERTVNELDNTPLHQYDVKGGVLTFNQLVHLCEGLSTEIGEEMTKWQTELEQLRLAFTNVPQVIHKKLAKQEVKGFTHGVTTAGEAKKTSSSYKDLADLVQLGLNIEALVKTLAVLQKTAAELEKGAKDIEEAAKAARRQLEEKQEELERKKREEEERVQREKEEEEKKRREEERQRKEREEEERKQREEGERLRKEKEEEERKRKEEEEELLRKEEEERKQREEEESKIREEEERLRKEEEKKRKRKEAEKLKWEKEKEAERKRKEEEEKRNPKNWNKRVYKAENSELAIACVIRAMPGTLDLDTVSAENVDQLDARVVLEETEVLVSNVVRVTKKDSEEVTTAFELSVCHCAPSKSEREIVVKMRDDDHKWQVMPSYSVNFDGDLTNFKFFACHVKTFGDLMVVQKIKTDTHFVGKAAKKIVSTTDSRATLEIKPNTFVKDTRIALQVHSIDNDSMKIFYTRDTESASILAASPFLSIKIEDMSSFRNAIQATSPLPADMRPNTTKNSIRTDSAADLSKIHILSKVDNKWKMAKSIDEPVPVEGKADVVSFSINNSIRKLLILRCIAALSVNETERLAKMLETIVNEKRVRFIMRQHKDNPRDIKIVATSSDSVQDREKQLEELGYSSGTTTPSDILLTEGQTITADTNGNIYCKKSQQVSRRAYNSCFKTEFGLQVDISDIYLQKHQNTYSGYVDIYGKAVDEADRVGELNSPEKNLIHLTRLQIDIPKDMTNSREYHKVGLSITRDVCVNDALLRQLSQNMEDDWLLIAQRLGLKKSRIQNIQANANTCDLSPNRRNLEVLTTWIRNTKASDCKANDLKRAMEESNRSDLQEIVTRRYNEYYTRRMAESVAGADTVVSKWKRIGQRLHIDNEKLQELEAASSIEKERFMKMIDMWIDDGDSSPHAFVAVLETEGQKYEAEKARKCLQAS